MSLILATIFICLFLQRITGQHVPITDDIVCEEHKSCVIVCDHRYRCGNSNIICPMNRECSITCTTDSCNQTTIDAKESSQFNLYLHQIRTHSELTLYLPLSSTTNIHPFFNNRNKRWSNASTNNKISLILYSLPETSHAPIESDPYSTIHSAHDRDMVFTFSLLSWSYTEANLSANGIKRSPSHRRRLLQSPTNAPTYTAAPNSTTYLEVTLDNSTNAFPHWVCNESCTDGIDHMIQINVEYSFSDQVTYNLKNMECFLYKIFATYDFPQPPPLGPCDIEITKIDGGTYTDSDLLCEFEPCFRANRAMNHGNTTMIIITEDSDTYNALDNLSLRAMENEFQTEFMTVFALQLDVTIHLIKVDHILWGFLKSIDTLWYIIALLVLIFCCVLCLFIWYIRRSCKIKKKVAALKKEEEKTNQPQSPSTAHTQKLKESRHTAIPIPSRSREPITPSATRDLTITRGISTEKSKDDYTGVRMDDVDDSATDEDGAKTDGFAEKASLMEQVTPVDNQDGVQTFQAMAAGASSWHPSRTAHHWQSQPQPQMCYSQPQPQPPSALSMADVNFNMYRHLQQNAIHGHTSKPHPKQKIPRNTHDSSSDSLETIQPKKCSTPDTEHNSQHFPSDDDDDEQECDDKFVIKISEVDALIDDDMILSDLDSESNDHLHVNHQPRQTTMEFHRNLAADIINTDEVMDDIVKDIASQK